MTQTHSPGERSRRLPRSARREQLLGAAQEVFVAQGYHAAAMDDIAERAGVSKPVLYQHFPSKLELYLALLEVHADALERQVRDALESTTDNHDRVFNCVQVYFDFVDEPGGAFRLVFESDLRNEPMVRERVDRALQRSVEAIADTIARDTGLDRVQAELLSCGLAGAAEISARWWLDAGGRVDKQRAIELIQALAWRGISGYPLVASPPSGS
ncbi:MAG TPA: TetR/AcrR family transcriptional regulator [Mycobacteriales bacterium]|nr:TetR/AcrR family transcriptional regulator [Mycobacteriales bacterium]